MLSSLLRSYCPQVKLLGSANSVKEGTALFLSAQPQVIFLDIEMPYGSGFDLLRSLPQLTAEVIFVTAFNQYAHTAFRYAALDYLLKPVNIDQLQEAVKRAEQRADKKALEDNYKLLLRNLDEKEPARKEISISDKGSQYIIRCADIKYIIADGSYTHIHTIAKTFVSTKNLKDFEELLPMDIFSRIHHGHIVNTHHIVKIQKGRGGTVHMSDNTALEISVRRKEGFLSMLKTSKH